MLVASRRTFWRLIRCRGLGRSAGIQVTVFTGALKEGSLDEYRRYKTMSMRPEKHTGLECHLLGNREARGAYAGFVGGIEHVHCGKV